MDRLHYEPDPCVRYDAERKLWVYMHRARRLEYDDWSSKLREGCSAATLACIMPNCLSENAIPLDSTNELVTAVVTTEMKEQWLTSKHRETDVPTQE